MLDQFSWIGGLFAGTVTETQLLPASQCPVSAAAAVGSGFQKRRPSLPRRCRPGAGTGPGPREFLGEGHQVVPGVGFSPEVPEEVRGGGAMEVRGVAVEVEEEQVGVLGEAGDGAIAEMGIQVQDEDALETQAAEVVNSDPDLVHPGQGSAAGRVGVVAPPSQQPGDAVAGGGLDGGEGGPDNGSREIHQAREPGPSGGGERVRDALGQGFDVFGGMEKQEVFHPGRFGVEQGRHSRGDGPLTHEQVALVDGLGRKGAEIRDEELEEGHGALVLRLRPASCATDGMAARVF